MEHVKPICLLSHCLGEVTGPVRRAIVDDEDV
jgi:hypothetical protein